ncbi:MAG: pentapeptide repeat-containing protein [SAR324 cluster bacterium]|nr:pentapeptide repeat-containing protein [SAR324 cluster bacterium]
MQLSKELFIKLQQSVEFFKSFTAGELLALLKIAKSESLQKDEIVFKEGTIGDKMYIIMGGTVRISRPLGKGKEEILVVLAPGACFGEMGVIDQSPRSARATAHEGGATVLSISAAVLSEHNVLLAFKLYKNFAIMLAGRLRDTNDKLQEVTDTSRSGKDQLKTLMKKKLEAGASMEGTSFKNADLAEVFMNNANFKGASLIGAKFSGVKAKQTNFTDAKFTSATLSDNVFEQGTFDKADFSGASFSNCTFAGCNMRAANFLGADLTEAQIETIEENKKHEPPPLAASEAGSK